MILRLLIVALVLAAAFGTQWGLARRRPSRAFSKAAMGLGPGIWLVTSTTCTLCGPAERSLRGQGLSPRVVDVGEVHEIGIRSVPTLLVIDEDGVVVSRRSGRAVIDDAPLIPGLVRSSGVA